MTESPEPSAIRIPASGTPAAESIARVDAPDAVLPDLVRQRPQIGGGERRVPVALENDVALPLRAVLRPIAEYVRLYPERRPEGGERPVRRSELLVRGRMERQLCVKREDDASCLE